MPCGCHGHWHVTFCATLASKSKSVENRRIPLIVFGNRVFIWVRNLVSYTKKGHRLRVLKNRILRKIFGTKKEERKKTDP